MIKPFPTPLTTEVSKVSEQHHAGPKTVTQAPATSGASVIGLKFNGGVVLAADMVGSYGSLARYRQMSRIFKVNNSTVTSATGDLADYQYLTGVIERHVIRDDLLDDNFAYSPKALHQWLTRVMYNRRSKFNPLWNVYIVGGVDAHSGETYLGYVNMIGVSYINDAVATGFGAFIGLPVLRAALDKYGANMTQAQAVATVEQVMKLLYYRDCRATNKFQVAVITREEGVKVGEPQSIEGDWSLAHGVCGYE